MTFSTLITTDELIGNLQKSNGVIFDCRASLLDHDAGLNAYNEGHIPESIFCDLENDLSSKITNATGRHPLPDFDVFIKKLENWGVSNQSQVVVYDDMGGALAVRLWWQLKTLGHHKVAVLDGGITQWINEKKPLSTKSAILKPTTFKANINKNAWLSSSQIEENLRKRNNNITPSFTVLDARTPERFRGEEEPIDPVAGRIPGSINRAFQLNLDDNGLFLSAEKLRHEFEDIIQQTPQKSAADMVHLCGSGVTACHNMLAMEIAGLSGSRLYAGSWSEWIRDDKRPISVG